MASGGTIPNNRTQTVTFYNTTGIIEKEKGIYLSPRFKGRNDFLNEEVREAYLEVLDEQAVRDPDYTDIDISSWSPQDRTLTIRGNIDDFRLVTDEGDCLNYLIVTRNVTKGNVTNTYYYGFFITEVAQAGGSSIRVTVEPDDFTNVFYLHNKHNLTYYEINVSDYDPFNERMKNCYVQRQHYDRVFKQLSGYYILSLRCRMYSPMSEGEIQEGQPITLNFEDGNQTVVEGTVYHIDDRGLQLQNPYIELKVKTDSESEIDEPENYSSLVYGGQSYLFDYDIQDIEWERVANYSSVNKHIFLNQEESYKFKYQYRDKRIPFSNGVLFTDEELSIVASTSSFSSLTTALQKKILKACMQFLVVETKSMEMTGKVTIYVRDQQQTPYQTGKIDFRNYVGGLYRSSEVLIAPLFNIPELFMKYESAIKAYDFVYVLKDHPTVSINAKTGSDVYAYLNSNALADFVYSAYVVNDMCMPDELMGFNYTSHKIYFYCNTGLGTPSDKNLLLVGVDNNNTAGGDYEGLSYIYNTLTDFLADNPAEIQSTTYGFPMLMLSGYNYREITISIPEDDLSRAKNYYYDPVLEAEPYSFYSLSYLVYEMPFNKNRYYSTMTIKISYYNSINGGVKLSYIPSYTVEGKEFKYYNESLVFTLSSCLILSSDSFASYYYQNQAQMKNQFAVNDYNRGVDLAQHFFLSGPNAVGQSAFKRGGYGAIAETINQFAQMADESIDWAQSNKVIDMNQKAKLADMGARPDVVKQAGSDIFWDLEAKENRPYLNHYAIDTLSYNSIAKLFERIGYQVNLYTTLNVNNRVGWNYIKLISFDWNPAFDIMVGQEENLRKIFSEGVTLLHNKNFLTSGHNYETNLDE